MTVSPAPLPGAGRNRRGRGCRVTVLASGSAGNAVLLESNGDRLLIDAGVSGDAIGRALAGAGVDVRTLSAILLTHEHDDHSRGAGAISRDAGVPVVANAATLAAVGAQLSGAPTQALETGRPFEIGRTVVTAFPVPHDAVEPVGFMVQAARHRITIATDLGCADESLDPYLADADLVVLESNYDLRLLHISAYPWFLKNRILGSRGHLSNDDAARALARTSGRGRVICLAHLSEVNNLPSLARDTVWEALLASGSAPASGRGPAPAGPHGGTKGDRVLAVPPNGRSDPIELD
jgi:phosphoribosyl 1,2-cyclic phosphodiesterase